MREILFRGKRMRDGTWIYGQVFTAHNIEHDDKIETYLVWNDAYCNTAKGTVDFSEVDTDTVGQFTGLLDKNGNKIFDGDIVRDLSVYSVHEGFLKRGIETLEQIEKYRYNGAQACVEFCTENVASCGCCYPDFVGSGFKAQFVDLTCCEVIGNKWDNPELLNP